MGPARFGPFVLDRALHALTRDGRDVHLTPKAFELLVLLVSASPRVVSKTAIHASVWPGTFVSDATLVGLVKELRRALGDVDESIAGIRTVHRIGYAFTGTIEGRRSEEPRLWHWVVTDGSQVALRVGDNLIGRDPSSVVWLDSAGVSRRHAQIVVADTGVVIEDLRSKNGTRLWGTLVEGRVALTGGDRVEVGPVVLIYRASSGGMSTETLPIPSQRSHQS